MNMIQVFSDIFLEVLYVLVPFVLIGIILFSGVDKEDLEIGDETDNVKSQNIKNSEGTIIFYMFGVAFVIMLLIFSPVIIRGIALWLSGF